MKKQSTLSLLLTEQPLELSTLLEGISTAVVEGEVGVKSDRLVAVDDSTEKELTPVLFSPHRP